MVASQGALAMRAIGSVVARLIIANEGEGLGYAQAGTRQHDSQQQQDLGRGSTLGLFLNLFPPDVDSVK